MKYDAIFEGNNRFLWMLLAFQGGLVNVGAFLSVHTFISHLSGIPGLVSYELWNGDVLQLSKFLLVPVCFFFGAFLTSIPTEVKRFKGKTPIYIHILSLIGVVYFFLAFAGHIGLVGRFGEPFSHNRDFIVLCTLGFVCGSQNALFSNYSQSVLRTTHITGLVTDLGIGISKFLFTKSLEETYLNKIRLELIISFFLGSIIGYPLFNSLGFLGFLIPALISFSVGVRLFLSRLKNH